MKAINFLIISFLCMTPFVSAEETKSEHKFGALTLKFPKNWKKEKPASRMRVGQFSIPAKDGKGESSELVIFHFGNASGGGTEANFKRWEGQFNSSDRKATRSKGKSSNGAYHMIDITGTYNKSIGPPIMRKTQAVPESRVISVIVETKEGNYFLKLIGKEADIKKHVEEFKKGFGTES